MEQLIDSFFLANKRAIFLAKLPLIIQRVSLLKIGVIVLRETDTPRNSLRNVF